MKKLVYGALVLLLCSSIVFAMGGPAPSPTDDSGPVIELGQEYVLDDFESGSLRSPREWWTFDIKTADIAANDALTAGEKETAARVGKYSLALKGLAKDWYVGGCGTYVAEEGKDLSGYNAFQIDVYGAGPGSGTLKIELLDDDNNNWQVEQDPGRAYAPIYDDKLVYDVNVDWTGWKRITILLDDFVDDNDGVGDDIWNPSQRDGSGGFLQIQFVCLATKDTGSVNFNVDNISLTTEEE